MCKIGFVILALAVAACSAEPAVYRQTRTGRIQRVKFSDRQQTAAAPAPTPYPSADELKPEIPFEEGVAEEPDLVYGPPDQTYGPPDDNTLETLPSDEAPPNFTPNSDAEEFNPARLTKRGRRLPAPAQLRRTKTVRAQRLVASAPLVAPANNRYVVIPVQAQQLRFIDGPQPFAYTAQLQAW